MCSKANLTFSDVSVWMRNLCVFVINIFFFI